VCDDRLLCRSEALWKLNPHTSHGKTNNEGTIRSLQKLGDSAVPEPTNQRLKEQKELKQNVYKFKTGKLYRYLEKGKDLCAAAVSQCQNEYAFPRDLAGRRLPLQDNLRARQEQKQRLKRLAGRSLAIFRI
jgi:hypothetical protein